MESHGTPGRIQITRPTYELLADEFECEPRGPIAVKGKGEIEAWYLVGPRTGHESTLAASGVPADDDAALDAG
jgi:class 3 adenylate cyclase